MNLRKIFRVLLAIYLLFLVGVLYFEWLLVDHVVNLAMELYPELNATTGDIHKIAEISAGIFDVTIVNTVLIIVVTGILFVSLVLYGEIVRDSIIKNIKNDCSDRKLVLQPDRS